MKQSRRNKERAARKAEQRQGKAPVVSKYARKHRVESEPVKETALAAALTTAKEKADD